jgi:hypothetical protein
MKDNQDSASLSGKVTEVGVSRGKTMAAWGDDYFSQVSDTPTTGTFDSVNTGRFHSTAWTIKSRDCIHILAPC